jgi:putative nucleotidyltransferase with HDIG domain
MPKRRILFVDDQQAILDGLKRVLRKMTDQWDMEFVTNGGVALERMAQQPFDLIVTDMIMPQMNGVELLREVRKLYPETVRFVLSGHSDRELILQATGFAHRYLAKPCDPEALRDHLHNSLGLRELLNSEQLHARISSISTLPAVPHIYRQLVEELQSEMPSVQRIASLISGDIGITAKMLHMVNSAFFGLPTRVTNVLQAVNLLGLDTVQGLVLAAGLMGEFEQQPGKAAIVERIYKHSLLVGTLAQKTVKLLQLDKRTAEDALMAGLLHDIGKLVLLVHLSAEQQSIEQIASVQGLSFLEAEIAVLGVTHATIGAHLLSLWGLPDSIVEAVAYHHTPSDLSNPRLSVLTAVYLASQLADAPDGSELSNPEAHFDMEYLRTLGITDILPRLATTFESVVETPLT